MPLAPRIVNNCDNRSPSPNSSTSSSTSEYTPRSQTATTKNRFGNVFSRLTGGSSSKTSTQSSPRPTVGKFLPFVSDTAADGVLNLSCKRVILGHRKPIVSLCATEEYLFSSSKDKTIKMWDLHTEKEVFQYSLTSTVHLLQFEHKQKLLFTVDSSKILVWDTQMGIDKPLKVLQESKQINFIVIDSDSRLWTAHDKYVSGWL